VSICIRAYTGERLLELINGGKGFSLSDILRERKIEREFLLS